MTGPIELNESQRATVSKILDAGRKMPSFDMWKCDEAESVKRSVKAHSIKSQNRCCCYCMEKVNSDNFKMWEVEHVLPQKNFREFTFEPGNLAVSCPDCNTIKSNKAVSKSKQYKRFPKSTASYTIVHPHFDRYVDHIHKVGLIFHPKSSKGRKTIEICGLLRYSEKFINWESPDTVSRIEEEAESLQDGQIDKHKVKQLINDLMALL
jgi:hypothetical protein